MYILLGLQCMIDIKNEMCIIYNSTTSTMKLKEISSYCSLWEENVYSAFKLYCTILNKLKLLLICEVYNKILTIKNVCLGFFIYLQKHTTYMATEESEK